MRQSLWLMVVGVSAGLWCGAGEMFAPPPGPVPLPSPADRQFAFAEDLRRSGDGQLAILEFRRLVFMFPEDPRVPDARLIIARSYLEFGGDVAAARRELAILADRYPNTKAAERGQQLDALIEANREMDYKPLLIFFAALSARERGENAIALRRLDEMMRSYPQAQLAPESLLMRGQVLESDGKLDDAIAAYAEVPARYPNSPLLSRALFGQAKATETRDGMKPHVAGLYGQISQRYPGTPYATQAQERLAAIRRGADHIERRFAAAGVLPYRAAQIGYSAEGNVLEVQIDITQEGTEAQVKATLEDALIKYAGQRKTGEHSVKVVARFLQTRKKAGVVKWTRDQQPDYDIERIKARDKHRGALEDLLK